MCSTGLSQVSTKFTLWDRGGFYYIIPYPMKREYDQQPKHLVVKWGHTWNTCQFIPPEYKVEEWGEFDDYTLFLQSQEAYELKIRSERLSKSIQETKKGLERIAKWNYVLK